MNLNDIENLAELARIELSPNEKDRLLVDMDSILGYVKQIESVIQAENVKLDCKLCNVWREDNIEEREFSKEAITGQFPNSQDNFLKVKKIL